MLALRSFGMAHGHKSCGQTQVEKPICLPVGMCVSIPYHSSDVGVWAPVTQPVITITKLSRRRRRQLRMYLSRLS